MKKLIHGLLLALCLLGQALAAEPAPAPEPAQWQVDATAAFNSRYVWRGQVVVNDPVWQPSLNLAKGGFSLNLWGSYDLSNQNKTQGKFTEIDIYGEYAFTCGDYSIPLGFGNYQFPNTHYPANTELYTGISYNWLITPTLKVYQDIKQAHGEYVNLALAYAHDLPRPGRDFYSKLALSAAVGYNSRDDNRASWGVDSGAFNDGVITIGLPIKIKDALTITPALTQVWLLDGRIREAAGYDAKTLWGLTLAMSF